MPMCGLGVPVGCRMKHANSGFGAFPKAGKRQAWTPRRSHGVLRVLSFLGVWSVWSV